MASIRSVVRIAGGLLLFVVVASVGAACTAAQPEESLSAPESAAVGGDAEQPAVTVEPTAILVPATPAASPTTETTEPSPTATSTPTPEPGATLLLPADGWSVDFLHADVLPAPSGNPVTAVRVATEAGVFGPVVEAHFVDGIDYRYIGTRGAPYHDVTTTAGAPVRVRTPDAPRSITAVMSVEDSSIVATSYDVAEADLLEIIDGLSVDNGVIGWDDVRLPPVFQLDESTIENFVFTQYQLRRGGESMSLLTVPIGHWQMPLQKRTLHPGAEVTQVGGRDALVHDAADRDGPGAVYSDGQLFYLLTLAPDASGTLGSAEDVRNVLASLEEVPISSIAADLGLVPRSELLGEWIANTPLPADVDLSWMLQGPPVLPADEAFRAHQVFACAWAGQWIETGDAAALDAIEANESWPTTKALTRDPMGALVDVLARSIEAARTLTDPSERESSALALDCSFLLGPIPG